ncbi:bifunctional riboflavin kinase/FAD synthetase [Terrabacter aeriphilus]|uniref:Riboflavin biosynthesis protein n=1 Tax=Terrabacter aeriphilus TaxID=515662 RepID=A0ABP9J9Z0_9MICO
MRDPDEGATTVVAVQRWYGLDDIPADLGPTVVTLGNFDGVHRGHREVLTRVVREAAERGAVPVAVTFEPHPVAVLYPDRAPAAVMSLEQRLDALASVGVGAVLVLRFTTEFAQQTPEDFVRATFVDALHATAVVVGKDTRFGVRNSGDVETLRALGALHGFGVVALDDIGEAEVEGARWSSTQLRAELLAGKVGHAAQILGRPHRVSGTVVHGDHRGRELGYPTANLSQDHEGLVPADGVYAGWLVRLDLDTSATDRALPAAVSVGTNPTFDGQQRRVEAYVLDRTDLDLYGERVAVEFVSLLRPTLRFDSIEALVEQMAQDVDRCREILSAIVPS